MAGGSERSTVTIANALAERGHDVSIISYTGKDTSPFFGIKNSISRYYLAPAHDRWPVLFREVRRIVLLRRLYADLKPDVIVVIGTTRAFVNVPAAKGYRMVAKEYFSVEHRSQLTSYISRKIMAHHADAIVTLSTHDADVYTNRYGARKTVVLSNPPTLVHPEPSDFQHKVVLGLGRLSYVKGFDLLLDAWSQINHGEWQLHIVGDGKMKKKLQQIVRDNHIEDVCFLPATADVAPLYRNASLFVLPSRSEAFGNVLLEAMSVGLPVVCFDCGAGPGDIVDNEVTGLMVASQDTKAMSAALEQLMNNPQRIRQMSAAALAKVQCYDKEVIIDRWETFLQELIAC